MFWNRFVAACNNKGVSPTAVVTKLGISGGSLTKWKNGSKPHDTTVQKIADYFGVSVDYLLGRAEEKPAEDGGLMLVTRGEMEILLAYRKKTDMQGAVKRLLEVDETKEEPFNYRLVASGGDNVITDSETEPHIT